MFSISPRSPPPTSLLPPPTCPYRPLSSRWLVLWLLGLRNLCQQAEGRGLVRRLNSYFSQEARVGPTLLPWVSNPSRGHPADPGVRRKAASLLCPCTSWREFVLTPWAPAPCHRAPCAPWPRWGLLGPASNTTEIITHSLNSTTHST